MRDGSSSVIIDGAWPRSAREVLKCSRMVCAGDDHLRLAVGLALDRFGSEVAEQGLQHGKTRVGWSNHSRERAPVWVVPLLWDVRPGCPAQHRDTLLSVGHWPAGSCDRSAIATDRPSPAIDGRIAPVG
jgi:hypothetical protein